MNYKKNLIFTSLFTVCCATSLQSFELIKNQELSPVSYDIASLQKESSLRPLLRQDEIKLGFKELHHYYDQLASPTLELTETTEHHNPLLDSLTNPELVIVTTNSMSEPDAQKMRYYYAMHLIEKINGYKKKLSDKQTWLSKQNKLMFIFKRVYGAISRFALGSACYLVGCFVAKYAVREKQIKTLPTAGLLFAGGSYCIGQAGKQLMTSIYYDAILQGHLRQTSNHIRELEAKIKNLQKFNEQLERSLNQQDADIQSPIIPEDAQSEKELND